MTLKHLNYTIEERAKTRPAEQIGGLEHPSAEAHAEVRPELIRLFHARWKHNEPGLRLLAKS